MAEEAKKPNIIGKIIRPIIFLAILGGGAYYGYKKYQYAQTYETTENAQIETHTAPIVSRVAGYVNKVNLEDFGKVQGGSLVIDVDATDLELALKEMEADYQASLADVENAKAGLTNTKVSLNANDESIKLLQVRLAQAKRELARNQNLYNDKALTIKQLEDSQNVVQVFEQQILQESENKIVANSRVGVGETAIDRTIKGLAVKKARIDAQKLKIAFTKIHAPISGKIGKKNVEVGQYIQPGQTLATIVNDSTYWIVANFKETQLARMKEGQPVSIKLDSYPDLEIKGKINTFSEATGAKFALLPPDNSSGNFVKVTQRVPVKISIDNVEKYKDILKAGLSLEVEVKVK